ncbi:ATP-binding protein [Flavobacterium sp. CFS9]|uniref:ATP-binding protein n=1 Tax=Flavobacterium sp. CFS9 TaxID=3143118 RepID=A0AAT9H0K9_9FLAO
MIETNPNFEEANPNPEYLIKSIAEQGYSLETSLADLMDNSISANADKIEVLIKMDEEPFKLFLADNGEGMDEDTLKASMQFPSNSPEYIRGGSDLGRFGLGMKTASFSQTRCFTVLSRKKGEQKYSGRTWDVEFLKKEKKWRLIVNSSEEIEKLVFDYSELNKSFLGQFESFEANTIVIWNGLYKFENYLEESNRQNALKKEITEITSDYLSLVFHKFMEREKFPINIRINNKILIPFNPFPVHETDFRPIAYKQRHFSTDTIKMEGFVLPSRSIDESRKGITNWTTKNRGLMDMEGIYIYRSDRIILFGGWNGLIKKAPRLQLARLRVEIGNSVDHLLHLNVAKSQIVIPHDLKKAFERYIEELKIEAEKEFFNRGIRDFSNSKQQNRENLFERKASNKGVLLELNSEFPLLKEVREDLSKEQSAKFNLVLRMINTSINKIRHTHEETAFLNIEEKDGLSLSDIVISLTTLQKNGFSSEQIKKDILPGLGFEESSLPEAIKQLLK